MHRRVPQNRTLVPSQSHSLSACDESQITGDASGAEGVDCGGVWVPVGQVDDAWYMAGDLIDHRYADDRPQRTFVPHSSGPVVGAGPAQTPGGAR